MINTPGRLFAALVATFIALAANAAADGKNLSTSQARQVVADFMSAVNSLHAEFEQTLRDETGATVEEESGELWLQRPGQFRWRYAGVSEREIVADPENIWLYDAELDQVTVRPVENAITESPAALLVGDIAALDEYSVSGSAKADGTTTITLEPLEPKGDFKVIELGFRSGELALLDLSDRFGQRTSIRFFAVERNPEIAPSVFDFILPDGADVIDQRGR